MKKTLIIFVLMAAMTLSLTTVAFAETPSDGGIYNVSVKTGTVAYVAQDASGAEVKSDDTAEIDGVKVDNFYANAEKLQITVSNARADDYYLVIAQNDDGVPTSSNIVYIDQSTATGNSITFTVYPAQLEEGAYHVYLASNESAREEVLSFNYYVAYILGDVNGDKDVNAADALMILQYYAGTKTDLTHNQLLAADVDKDTSITASDALKVLQQFAGI